ncbi:hypothetical protein [Bdellovibrio sp. HCB209]|uniref:hypothetical protein n=1 Tax=Bdellovibrio sp. HCB209 TaxID=3394354 RepID=UPI0039B47947
MKKFILLSMMIALVCSTLLSCGSPPKKEDAASTSPDEVGGLGDNAALYASVSTIWQGLEAKTEHGKCVISSDESEGYSRTCTITIPEGQLYFSSLNITIGTKTTPLCPVVSFTPYRYQIASDDTSYIPPGETTAAKCGSELEKTPKCWGGAATQMVSSFPTNKGMYQVTASLPQYTYEYPSENELGWYSPRSNRGTINNLLTPTASQAGYVANSMRDYTIVCQDLWAQPIYTIVLKLVDKDTEADNNDVAKDQIPDWQ